MSSSKGVFVRAIGSNPLARRENAGQFPPFHMVVCIHRPDEQRDQGFVQFERRARSAPLWYVPRRRRAGRLVLKHGRVAIVGPGPIDRLPLLTQGGLNDAKPQNQ